MSKRLKHHFWAVTPPQIVESEVREFDQYPPPPVLRPPAGWGAPEIQLCIDRPFCHRPPRFLAWMLGIRRLDPGGRPVALWNPVGQHSARRQRNRCAENAAKPSGLCRAASACRPDPGNVGELWGTPPLLTQPPFVVFCQFPPKRLLPPGGWGWCPPCTVALRGATAHFATAVGAADQQDAEWPARQRVRRGRGTPHAV
eukprot:gene25009-biopygen7448